VRRIWAALVLAGDVVAGGTGSGWAWTVAAPSVRPKGRQVVPGWPMHNLIRRKVGESVRQPMKKAP
jgi:hypothetical protein